MTHDGIVEANQVLSLLCTPEVAGSTDHKLLLQVRMRTRDSAASDSLARRASITNSIWKISVSSSSLWFAEMSTPEWA